MIKSLLWAILILGLATIGASAQNLLGILRASSGGGAVTACSLALKFNVACNSQYATVIHF